jgi:hypothetical protein
VVSNKIRQKAYTTPKVYKSKPKATGWERLAQRTMKLLIDADRYASKALDLEEQQKALHLAQVLKTALESAPADPATQIVNVTHAWNKVFREGGSCE